MKPSNLKDIIRAGLIRFATEGYLRWPKSKVSILISPKDVSNTIEDSQIKKIFYDLEKEGLIRFLGSDDVYLEVIDSKIK